MSGPHVSSVHTADRSLPARRLLVMSNKPKRQKPSSHGACQAMRQQIGAYPSSARASERRSYDVDNRMVEVRAAGSETTGPMRYRCATYAGGVNRFSHCCKIWRPTKRAFVAR